MEPLRHLLDVYGLIEEGGDTKLVCKLYDWKPYRMFLVSLRTIPEHLQALFTDDALKQRPFPIHDDPITLVVTVTSMDGPVIGEWAGEAEEEITIEPAPVL